MKILLSVPPTVDVVPLVKCLQRLDCSFWAPPNTAVVLHTHKILCKLVLSSLGDLELSSFQIVVIGLSDVPHTVNSEELPSEDSERCAVLVRAAGMIHSMAAIGHPSLYGLAIDDLNSYGRILPSTRLHLAGKAFYVATEWTGHTARNKRLRQDLTKMAAAAQASA